jgi:hypothetical protein
MNYVKKFIGSSAAAFVLSASLASRSDWYLMVAAGTIAALSVSVIFLLVFIAVKLAPRHRRDATEIDESAYRLTGFDAEGNLKIHSWLRHGGK